MAKIKNTPKRGLHKKRNPEGGNMCAIGTSPNFSHDTSLLNKRIPDGGQGTVCKNNSACCNSEVNDAQNKSDIHENPIGHIPNASNVHGIGFFLEQARKNRNKPVAKVIPKCIDLSNDDVLREKEVIDLTEASAKSVECDASEPTIIDISDEEASESPESEEVLVVGMFPKSSSPLEKKSLNDRLADFIICKEKIVKDFIPVERNKDIFKFKKKKARLRAKRRVRSRPIFKNRCKENLGDVGSNIYVNSPPRLPSSGLRPIIIDGCNVAYRNSGYNFCCKRLEICINYFKEKGHKVTAFVPEFKMSCTRTDNPELLKKLEEEGYVIFTPSKEIDGTKIVSYDDRFIVQTAVLQGGIIVSKDNYRDLLRENPAWAETIKYRTLAFTWVGDILMFPEDPLGVFGPKLKDFLRFN